MEFKDKIVNTKPRENSGPTSSSRFDYQKDWGICKLLECHQTKSDYLIVFDWHNDLVILDSENNPAKISFFQIKGKQSGNWSVSSLIKSDNDKDGNPLLSIIGKLYDCKLKYEFETTSLNFVSNARFSVGLEDNSSSTSKNEICIIELTKAEKIKITNKIKEEHKLKADPVYEDITFFKVLDLSLDDSKIHTQGKISDFFETLCPGLKLSIPTIYKLLFDEVKRRTNYNKEILTFNDLIANKALGKNQFENIINAAGLKKDYYEIWNRAEILLNTCGFTFQKLNSLKKAWTKLEIERMNPANTYLYNIVEKINKIVIDNSSDVSMQHLNLLESIEFIFDKFYEKNKLPLGYDNDFIKAIILSKLYE